jgi:circadian clock protein KaiC
MKPSGRRRHEISIHKSPIGIAGLDEITEGGLPQGGVTIIEGTAGAGKTLLALQMLVHGVREHGEPGIFVAFEEESARIKANAASFGWDLPALQQKKLFFLDAQPDLDVVQSGAIDLGGLLTALDSKVAEMRARRIVFDAIDVVLSMLDNPAAERLELSRLRQWIMAKRLTGVITSKGGPVGSGRRRKGILQFMSDCAVSLEHGLVQGVSHRNVRVQKYRGSSFHENSTPFVIGASGFEVARVTSDHAVRPAVTTERVSSGIEPLDSMLGGGFFRGAGILVTGSPGTAKTTLGGAFAEAACERGESTLMVSFDSASEEVVRNLSSVGIRLQRFLDHRPHRGLHRPHRGLLGMAYARGLDGNAETHLVQIQALVRQQRARCLVIDPISALLTAGNEARAQGAAKRLLDWAKAEGLTVFSTSLLESAASDIEGSPLEVSTIADTWIHLNYLVRAGERNRALTIVKSRGTAHSNQVRELILGADGISLAEAYSAGGEVLLGTMRREREHAVEAERLAAARVEQLNRLRLANEETELRTRLAALRRQLEDKRVELKGAALDLKSRRDAMTRAQSERLALRGVRPRGVRRKRSALSR